MQDRLYSTSEVAKVLGVPVWRIKNFIDGKAFDFKPTHTLGSGRGGRHLFNADTIVHAAILVELVNLGLTPSACGKLAKQESIEEVGNFSALRLNVKEIRQNVLNLLAKV